MELEERLRRAAGRAEELGSVLCDSAEEVLLVLLDNPRLTEEHVKVLLARKNLRQTFLRELAAREQLMRPYAVKLAFAKHPHAPRSVSLPLLRRLYLFDLAAVAVTPSVPVEVRRIAEEAVIARLEALSLGERVTLARSGSSRVATALLGDAERRVRSGALENPRLTEEGVVKALRDWALSAEAVEAIASHPRWSSRYEVRLALIRHPATSLRRMLELVGLVRRGDLADLTVDRRMLPDRRLYLSRLVRLERTRDRPGPCAGSSSPEQVV